MSFILHDEFELLQREIKEYRKNPLVNQQVNVNEVRTYNLNNVEIGFNIDTDEPFSIDFSKSKRICVISRTGGGKSVLNSAIVDRFMMSGNEKHKTATFMVDIKGEYLYKKYPLQEKYIKFLLSSEKPQGMEIETIYPIFLQRITNYELNKEVDEKLIKFPLNKLSFLDFKNIANITSENVNLLLDTMVANNITFNTFEEFENYVHDSEIHPVSKNLLIAKMKMLMNQSVFVSDDLTEEYSIIKALSESKIVNYNQKGLLVFMDITLAGIACSYLGVILNSIYNAKMLGGLDRKLHLLISIDESSIFIPRDKETTSKMSFMNLLKLSRSESISLYYCAQDWRYMPDDFIRQADLVFFGYNTTVDDLYDFVSSFFPSFYPVTGRALKGAVMDLISTLKIKKSGARPWLVFDMQKKNWYVIIPTVPLSYIFEEE